MDTKFSQNIPQCCKSRVSSSNSRYRETNMSKLIAIIGVTGAQVRSAEKPTKAHLSRQQTLLLNWQSRVGLWPVHFSSFQAGVSGESHETPQETPHCP